MNRSRMSVPVRPVKVQPPAPRTSPGGYANSPFGGGRRLDLDTMPNAEACKVIRKLIRAGKGYQLLGKEPRDGF